MANPNKAKGTRWETAVTLYLREVFPLSYKPRPEGYKDVGDIHVGPAILQAKDWANWQAAIREGLDGAVTQASNLGRGFGVAVVKRARRQTGEAYVVMRLCDFRALLASAYPSLTDVNS